MKILIPTDTYYPHVNGASYFAQRLAHYLQERGHTVAVIAPSESLHFTDKTVNGIRVFGVTSFSTFASVKFRFSGPFFIKKDIARVIADFKPDIIHMQSHFSINRTVFKIAQARGIPLVATNHFMPDNLTHYLPLPKSIIAKIDEWMWKDFAKVFNKVKYVTTPTEIAADLIRPRLSHPVTAISCGIDFTRFNPKNDGAYLRKRYNIPDKPVLLYVGRLDKEKKVDDVMRAVKEANKKIDFCLVLAGPGVETPRLKRLSKELETDHDVVFAGFIPDEDLANLYTIADCFIIAGIAELQSIVTMEAMASGLPVLAANAQALPELVKDGENGFLFEPGNISEMTEKMVTLFTDESLRKRFSEGSLKRIAVHDINAVISRFEQLYESRIK